MATALAVSLEDVFAKRFFGQGSAARMLSVLMFYSLPGCLAGALWLPVPHLGPQFWWSFWLDQPINGLSMWLYMRAIKLSPISLTMPLLALTPAILALLGWLFLDETLSWVGVLGILVLVLGGYLLFAGEGETGLWGPFRALAKDAGARTMLLVALLFSFSTLLGKVSVENSDALWHAFFFNLVQDLWMLPLFWVLGWFRLAELKGQWKPGLLVSGFYLSHMVLHNLAVILAQAAYMMSVKRLNLVFSVILGRLVLKETKTELRGLAAGVMVLGVVLISLWGKD
ncbi:MAG: hypothetical protein A2426_10765 [Candidatus Lambdaproteobacteria bacterium RIFOXYC1_FULL_56_13]|nr:MAG: hypothetical protein A2426_10765 [Candidatus Lambdaproteobacteria bacterium RIFOXYC1_FULL_56_13]